MTNELTNLRAFFHRTAAVCIKKKKLMEAKSWNIQIKDQRIKQKLTLKQVADAAGITLRYLQHIEAGARWPSNEVLSAICKAIKLKCIYL